MTGTEPTGRVGGCEVLLGDPTSLIRAWSRARRTRQVVQFLHNSLSRGEGRGRRLPVAQAACVGAQRSSRSAVTLVSAGRSSGRAAPPPACCRRWQLGDCKSDNLSESDAGNSRSLTWARLPVRRAPHPPMPMKTSPIPLALLVALLAPGVLRAQLTATPQWVNQQPATSTTPPEARLQTDAAGNTYLAATVEDPQTGDTDVMLYKFGCGGAFEWAQRYDHLAQGQADRLAGMDLDPAGNVYLAVNVAAAPGGSDWVVLSFSPAGVLRWRTSYGSPGLDRAVGLAVDARGAVAVAGEYDNGREVRAVKFDWQTGAPAEPVGVTPPALPAVQGTAMILDGAGNVWVTGDAEGHCVTLRFASRGAGLVFSGSAFAPPDFGPTHGVALAWDSTNDRVFVGAGVGDPTFPVQQAVLCYANVAARTLPRDTNWNSSGPVPGAFLKPPPPPPIVTEGERLVALAVARGGRIITLAGLQSPLGFDWLLAGWDPAGNLVAERGSGLGPGSQPPQFLSVLPAALAVDRAGRAYVTGSGMSLSGESLDFATARYAELTTPVPLGLEWFQAFDTLDAEDRAAALALDVAGNVLVAGSSTTVSEAALTTVKLCQGRPTNDLCGTALMVRAGTTAFTTCGATDTQPPVGFCGANRADVWFRWIAPATGFVEMDTAGSCFDTVLAVYTGHCGALAPVPGACNDNAPMGRPADTLQSFVRFPAVAGETYLIQVGLGGLSLGTGDGRLTIFGPLPPGEICPPDGDSLSQWRKFVVIGPGDSNEGGLWRVTVPGCADVLGVAPTAVGDPPAALAAKLAASINAACDAARFRAVAVDESVFLQVIGCAPGTPVVFRVGPAGTPPDQLCIVPEIRPDGTLDPTVPASCAYNPQLASVQVGPDCNGNGVPDEVDIASGVSQDSNLNGIPDECEGGLRIRRQGQQAVLFWGLPNTFLEVSPSLLPTDWQSLSPTSPTFVPLNQDERFFRLEEWP